MLGKPECLAAEQLRIVVPQQDSRLFIVAVTFAAVPKDAVSPEQLTQILPHCGKQFLYSDDRQPRFPDDVGHQLPAVPPAMCALKTGIPLDIE